jgi:hypothetical protein
MLLNFKVIFADLTDTVFRVMNDANNQIFRWTFNKKPVQFNFDPDDEIVLKQGTTTLGLAEPEALEGFPSLSEYTKPCDHQQRRSFMTWQKNAHVHMDIVDISGKIIASPLDENASAGKHWVDVNLSGFEPGSYFYVMQAGGFKQTRMMILTK